MAEFKDDGVLFKMVDNHANELRMRQAMKASIGKKPVSYHKIKVRKPSKFPKVLISTVLLMALSFTAGVKISTAWENDIAYFDTRNEVTNYATENISYGPIYHEDRKEFDWWYEIYDMADDVLNKESVYDIDTRIYGCYAGMKEYNKFVHMDKLFNRMQSIINSNPDAYSEDVIRACSYPTFKEYLDAKGLTLEEYEDLMKKVLIEYGKENKSNDELQELLAQLNGGGSR